MRRAAGGCLRSAAGLRSAECGVRPAGVCGAGRCLRSAECGSCGSCGVRTADCGAGRYPRSADRGSSTADPICGLRSFVIYLGRQFYLGRQRWEWLRFPTRPTRSAAALHRDGVRNVERSKGFINRSCNTLAASFPPTRILERSVGTLILQCTYLNTDNPFHKIIPTLFAPILSCLHFPCFPLVPV